MKAYCDRSGVIGFGTRIPTGTLQIAVSRSEKKLKDAVSVAARHSYDGQALLVPGVPEADDEDAALDALMAFRDQIKRRLAGLRPWKTAETAI